MSVPGNSESVEADAATEAALGRAAEAIWVAAQKASWSSLVLVPAEPSLSTAALAAAVAAVGSVQRGEPVERLDLEGLPLARSRSVAETLADETSPYRRVASLDCPTESSTALLLASAAGAAVLVLQLEQTTMASARRVTELIGPDRFIGAVLLRPPVA